MSRLILAAPLLAVLLGATPLVATPSIEPGPTAETAAEAAPETPPESSPETETAVPRILTRTLDRELERVEDHAATLADYENELTARRLAAQEAMERSRTFAAESAARLQPLARGAEKVEPVYGEVVERLKLRQAALAESLEQWRFAAGVPAFAPSIDARDLDAPGTSDRVALLREGRERVRATERRLREEERTLRRERVDLCAASVSRLYEVRTTALGKLPSARRKQVLGPTAEGLATLKLESQRLVLAARAYGLQTLQWFQAVPALVDDVFEVGRVSWAALKLLGVLLLFWIVRRRYKGMRETGHRQISRSPVSRTTRRRLHRLIDGAAVVTPWLVALLALRGVRWALVEVAERPEIDLPLRLIALYVIYRLINDVVVAVWLTLARFYRVHIDAATEKKLQRTVRLITRVAVAIAALLLASQSLLGRGMLYTLVVNAAWAVALLTFVVLLGRWRPIIADSYLKQAPDGRLAAAVRATKDRWYGVSVSAAAFVWLAGRGVFVVIRDFAMQFDGTRRALAFIFRRKMEKHAEKSGYATVDEAELPETIRSAFSPEDALDPALLIDRFPGLDVLQERLERWQRDEARGSFLLSGRKGIGKTAWLSRIDPGETAITRIALDHRMQSEAGLTERLARELGLTEAACKTLRALGKLLREGEPRVVVVDRMQNLFLSRVGGYHLFEAFVSLIELTSERIFWVGAMSGFACEHVFAVHPELMIFRHHQQLARWSEEEIGRLIEHRTEIAGARWDFEALLSDRFERRYAADRAVETAEGYTRLIWDYSSGNPRVALHFWLRSLVPISETRAKIKLFRPPDDKELDGLGNRGLFLLAAIVTHENLSLREAAQVTRYPDAICRIQLERLRDDRMLRLAEGRYRLSTHWHQAIVGHLSRHNLLPD